MWEFLNFVRKIRITQSLQNWKGKGMKRCTTATDDRTIRLCLSGRGKSSLYAQK